MISIDEIEIELREATDLVSEISSHLIAAHKANAAKAAHANNMMHETIVDMHAQIQDLKSRIKHHERDKLISEIIELMKKLDDGGSVSSVPITITIGSVDETPDGGKDD